jgi:dimethylargininase
MLIALTRAVSPSIAECELTHVAREPIDVARAVQQHCAYEQALVAAGCRAEHVPAEPALPDAVFVEDAAVVFDELAVLTRPGAASRRPEVASLALALAAYRTLEAIEAPGTLDGGDVLILGRQVYVGIGGRTNSDGAFQFKALLDPHGYSVRMVEVRGCLHLKSAVTRIEESAVLLNPRWVDVHVFDDVECVEVEPSEPYAANALLVGDTLLYGAGHPRTRERLAARGLEVTAVDLSELAKAEGALTCCSVIVEAGGAGTSPRA